MDNSDIMQQGLDSLVADEIIAYAQRISSEGFTKGTWGNISVLKGEHIYITPSGQPYDKLKREDICILKRNGDIVYAKNKPSSETALHVKIYESRNDVKAILHTHPIYSTVVSITLSSIPPIVEDAVMILGETLYVSEYALPGTIELAQNAVRALSNNHCAFLKNHGLVTVGVNLQEAFVATQVAEKTAQICIESLKLGSMSTIPHEHAIKLREKYLQSYRQK
ncbi:MAG TPA: class II aldolase/adducin family protein [Fervidobacterium sp.]|nr:class II aldolase/adducin family protein [Fervidobacterium sp.]HOM73535.1 class II aldolase/adducin family protein [Fervidobacterium sp.]HOQ39297.1 class II aldolase/adducin family protein [Fervidobacterium sp.]HPP17423.1 class II aldolase/adducin family protein [Fervidobacterium sp.]HPT54149.1 class II aldolase/adducin family protein [Fervidobacterium sp.]